ncbi:MAG: neutral zinc metallopeptidase [Acidobacteriota bacterium]
MRWTRGHVSANVEDRRGRRGARMPGGRRGGQLGCGGFLLLLLLSVVFKQDFFSLVGVGAGGGGGYAPAPTTDAGLPPGQDPQRELKEFVSFVLDDTQGVWARKLNGYRDAKLVLFTDSVRSACGFAQSASGPFYCPADQKVYIDLGFYDELSRRFGAPGDFAQAYVLAHEIGHHVQTLLGTSTQVRRLQAQNPRQANDLSVRMELQADCYAGVWAHSTARRDLLERGDIEEGLGAAAAVGDDRIQRMSGRGYINPESFTHGSSKQRMQWFRRGFETGDPNACDTFG